jgi:hypothetical protein
MRWPVIKPIVPSARDLGIGSLILLCHGLASGFGFHSFRMPDYMQVVQNQFPPGTPFWPMLANFHGNPPLLSVLHALAAFLFPCRPELFFDFVLPCLHVWSFWAFRKAMVGFGLNRFGWLSGLLFLNPMVWLYFRYPFYTSMLLFVVCQILLELSRWDKQPQKSLFKISAWLGLACLIRTSWSPFWLLPLLLVFLPAFRWKQALAITACFLPIFLWQAKNFVLIGKWTSSSWTGLNLYRSHHAWDLHPKTIDFLPPFSKPDSAFRLFAGHPDIEKCRLESNPYLSANNLNHKVIPVLSDLYLESLREEWSWTWSLQTMLNGWIMYLKSPADYPHLKAHMSKDWNCILFINPDFWDPFPGPDWSHIKRLQLDSGNRTGHGIKPLLAHLGPYTFLYTALLGFFGWNWRRLKPSRRFSFVLLLILSLTYASLDVMEANRMRMEVEPLFWFFLLQVLHQFFPNPAPTHQPEPLFK